VIEEVGHFVVGHENVHPAVVVVVGDSHTHPFSEGLVEAGLFRDVGESAVPVVSEQDVGQGFENVGGAVSAVSGLVHSAVVIAVLLERPLEVMGYKEIQLPVVVRIEPAGTGLERMARHRNTGFRSHVREGAVAVVVVQDAVAVAGYVDIREAVVVVVAGGHALRVTFDASPAQA